MRSYVLKQRKHRGLSGFIALTYLLIDTRVFSQCLPPQVNIVNVGNGSRLILITICMHGWRNYFHPNKQSQMAFQM